MPDDTPRLPLIDDNPDDDALAAWKTPDVAEDRAIRPILDARRERFHHATVRMQDGKVNFLSNKVKKVGDIYLDDIMKY